MGATDSGSSGEEYLLGSRDDESERLAEQHRVWAGAAFDQWSRAGFRAGATIVDLGCGPGFTTLDLARLVGPRGQVIAVDGSERFLEQLRIRAERERFDNVERIRTDLHELSLAPESVDGAYARWVFCFLTKPEAVVARVARALRPGAALAVTDYFNYRAFTFAPRSAVFDRVIAAVQSCWLSRGGDLEIQGRMPGMMTACGLEVVDVRQICRVAQPGSPDWNWPRSFFKTFVKTLESESLITTADRDAFERVWLDRARDPTARLFLPPQIEVIAVKR